MWCPRCLDEYPWDVMVCPKCDADLVERLPGPEPEPDARLVCAFSSGDAAAIAMARSLLDAEEVEYFVRGDNIQDLVGVRLAFGFNNAVGPAEFWVREEDASRVRGLLEGLAVPPRDGALPESDAT